MVGFGKQERNRQAPYPPPPTYTSRKRHNPKKGDYKI